LWSQGTEAAYRAARRYLMIHLLGGVVLFAGVTGHIVDTGDVAFSRMALDSPAHWLILIGFLVNAGAPPLSAWLPDAYPEASWSGSVFLSAFTTKTAVYVLIRGFPGAELLIWIGLFMAFYGIVYGLLENDIRRILAYSIVYQSGLMMVGIGIGTEMALNGASAQAFTGVIYVALLLMSAGSVVQMTGKRKCTELGGLVRTMPLTAACGVIGAMAISAFPLTSGFISKSMVSQAALDGHHLWIWLLLTAASAGACLHAGIKFSWFVFFRQDSGLRPTEPPLSMRWAMVLFSLLCIALGVWPGPLYALLPYAVNYVPYTGAHVVTQLQLLLFSGLAFFVLLPYLKRSLTITLDADWLWRILLPTLLRNVGMPLVKAWNMLVHAAYVLITESTALVLYQHRQEGRFARTWSTRSMALWVLVLLLGFLILYYV
jgi:multicomponent Na+:H+ antiporter subunit D